MKLDLQSLFGLLCTAVLIVGDSATSLPSPRIWVYKIIYKGAIGKLRWTTSLYNPHNSEFHSVEPQKAKSRNSVPNHSLEEKPTQNKTRQPNILKIVSEKTTFCVQTNHFVKLFCYCFVKLIFSAEFHSVPSFGIGSSAELGMPRNECFLPRNN